MPIREMISRLTRIAGTLAGLSYGMPDNTVDEVFAIIEQLDAVIGTLEEMEELERSMIREKKTV